VRSLEGAWENRGLGSRLVNAVKWRICRRKGDAGSGWLRSGCAVAGRTEGGPRSGPVWDPLLGLMSVWQMPTLPWAAHSVHKGVFTADLFGVFLPGPGVEGDRNQD